MVIIRVSLGLRNWIRGRASILPVILNVARKVNVPTAHTGSHSETAERESAECESAERALYTCGHMLEMAPETAILWPGSIIPLFG